MKIVEKVCKTAGRKIARIDYDLRNNPVRIQFTNGNVTKYVYSAAGEKLRVIYQTAVPNITVAIGSMRELAFYEIQHTDSTDYLLGGSLTLKNGRIDKYLFDEGYCQAGENTVNVTQDYFTINYYDRDHLGNIHQVTRADRTKTGTVIQTMDYYPFGAQFCHSGTDNNVQPYRYNGKEYDRMHGLNTYDFGARQYNPITACWDRVDPLAEKYFNVSPYVYCHNNPVILVDPDGRDDYYTSGGMYIGTNSAKTDYIYISDDYHKLKDGRYAINVDTRVALPVSDISAEALSKIFTHVIGRMPEVDLSQLDGKQINVVKWSTEAYGNGKYVEGRYGNCQKLDVYSNASTLGNNITVFYGDNSEMFETRSNIQNMLGAEEYTCHFKNQWHHFLKDSSIPNKRDNEKIFTYLENHPTWNKTTKTFKMALINYKNSFKK